MTVSIAAPPGTGVRFHYGRPRGKQGDQAKTFAVFRVFGILQRRGNAVSNKT